MPPLRRKTDEVSGDAGGITRISPWGKSLRRFRDGSRQQIDFAVQRREQTIEPVAAQDRAELRALGRQLADRAVEVDVRDMPDTIILAQQVVDADRLAARLG